jgi:hypothetical protein
MDADVLELSNLIVAQTLREQAGDAPLLRAEVREFRGRPFVFLDYPLCLRGQMGIGSPEASQLSLGLVDRAAEPG